MISAMNQFPPNQQLVVQRFVAACEADPRVVAATLYGSYARGTADAHSDLDLGLITTDADFADFYTGRADWLRQLGEPLFLENFGSAVSLLFILADGTEGELSVGRAGDFTHIHGEPHQVLLDKTQLLTGCVFAQPVPGIAEQRATLQRLIDWFWHDFSHLVTALGRGQLWWAQGQIEVLRLMCVNLARLRYNFADPYVDDNEYFKVDLAIPGEQLAPLATTFCPLEAGALLQAGQQILRFYQKIAPPLAQAHGLVYPAELERVLVARLVKL